MPADLLVHAEHVQGCLEQLGELLVQNDFALVLRFLQVVCFDILPQALDHLQAAAVLTDVSAEHALPWYEIYF